MKKLFTLFAAVAISSAAFAQRSVEFKLDSIYAPYELVSTAGGGTDFSVLFQCSNNGTDSIFAGDSIFYNFALYTASSSPQFIGAHPYATSANVFGFGAVVTKDMGQGDTVFFTATGNLPFRANITLQVIGQGGVYLVNRSNGQDFSNDAVSANNRKAYIYTWYNAEKWPLSAENMELDAISVYPNPAVNTVTVKAPIAGGDVATVKVYDMKGQLVKTEQTAANAAEHNLNVADMNNGVYVVEVSSGDFIKTTKLVVNH
ncbi:MAG: T9SS type A sorting domain-containing protein [Bacteroidetes bacterium]|nr:MAG: T9SS type A sorting domain-containing protein [Bacteroidota bacterium]